MILYEKMIDVVNLEMEMNMIYMMNEGCILNNINKLFSGISKIFKGLKEKLEK